ncbi:MAG TPA: ABC transporter permease [Terriglobales bacterium]|nr:ABC transporter permease [Terriglobales bacterium]
MRLFAQFRSWLKWATKPSRLESEMEAEVRFHIESRSEDLVRRGVPAQEAMRRARIEFGGVESHKDAVRASLGLRWSGELWTDVRYAGRKLRNSPGFTLTALLVLAIGIGVNVTAFGAFNVIVLKSLPVRDPDSLVRLERRSPENLASQMPYPSVVFYRDNAKTLSAAMATMGARIELAGDVQPVNGMFVTSNYFTELGTLAAYGRLLDPAQDDTAGADPAAVLSFGFWQRRFGADPSIVGKVISVNKKTATVVGVTPHAFASLGGQHPDVWLPMTQVPYFVEASKALTETSGGGSVEMWGRLSRGVTAKVAEQELLVLTNELRKQHPKDIWDQEFIKADPGGHFQVMKPEVYVAMALVGTLTLLILAVACANLGGLLLARGVTREHEIGIRVAIGASRQRIFRQLFTESLLLALLGSAAAFAMGYVVLRTMLVMIGAPAWQSAAPDWRVCLFAVGMALAAAIFFGLAPALQTARQRQRKKIARQLLVGAQVAASCVLLIVAGLLVRATQHVLYTDPGFGYEQVSSIDPGLASHSYTPIAARAYMDQFESRLRALPGVTSVSLSSMSPLGHENVSTTTADIGGKAVTIYPSWVDADFFCTMDIPLLHGRNLLPGENNAVILSESLARKQFPGQDPVGKRFWEKDVVGVAANARTMAMNDGDAMEMYQAAQTTDMPSMVVLVKTVGPPEGLPPMAKSIAESIDPKLFPYIRLLKSDFQWNVQQVEHAAMAVSLLGIAAVLLAAIGLLGLVAYTVSERTKEIAIRIALGARPGHVLFAILRQFVWSVAVGLLAGLVGTAVLSQVLRRVLFGVSNLDSRSYLGAIGILLVVATVAALWPARRALRVNPMRALHYD